MRGLLVALCQQLGLLQPSGTIDLGFPDGVSDGPFTFYDGPSFICTDKGVEGPHWASMLRDDPSWTPEGRSREETSRAEENLRSSDVETPKRDEPGDEAENP